MRPMKVLMAIFLLLGCIAQAAAGERVQLYARVIEDLVAQLSDGSKWEIAKGDCFPVIAYKEAHTKLVLQLAGTIFIVPGNSGVIVGDKEKPAAIERYRATVNSYINGFAARWRSRAEAAAGQPK
jgi:hypothetical protein